MTETSENINGNNHKTAHINPGQFDGFRVHKTYKKKSMNLLGFNLSEIANTGDQNFKLAQMAGQGILLYDGLVNKMAGLAISAFLNGSRQALWHRLKGSEKIKKKLKNKKTRRKIETAITGFASISSIPQAIDPESSIWDAAAATCALIAYGELSIVPWMQFCEKVRARNISREIFNTQREITQKIDNVKHSQSNIVGITSEIDEKLKRIDNLNNISRKYEKRITQSYNADLIAGALLLVRGGFQLMAGVSKLATGNTTGLASITAGGLFILGGGFMFLNKLGERNERINRSNERFAHQTAKLKEELGLSDNKKADTITKTDHLTMKIKPT